MARIQAMLRRPRGAQSTKHQPEDLTFGDVRVDVPGRDVWLRDEPVALTRTEFDLLAALAEQPRLAFSRRQLIEHVWGLSPLPIRGQRLPPGAQHLSQLLPTR